MIETSDVPGPGSRPEASLSDRRREYECNRRRRWWRAAAVVGAVSVAAGAVSGVVELHARAAHDAVSQLVRQEARMGDPAVPAVVWPRGYPDHGRWVDDPWVRALREFHLLEAAAFNSGRIEGRADLLRLAEPDRVDQGQDFLRDAWSRLSESDDPPVYFGPAPFEVLDVIPDGEGDRAEVLVCMFIPLSVDEGDSPDEVLGRTAGYRRVWQMVRGQDGHIRYFTHHRDPDRAWGDQGCEISDVHYGRFDPVPTRLEELPTDDRTWMAGVDAGLRLEDLDDADDLSEYVDHLTGTYDRIREQAERAARR